MELNLKNRKAIVLAGGSGSRLFPLTLAVSKQLLPIYDKPLVYYPLSTLIMADVREVLFVTAPRDMDVFKNLLGDGSQWGMKFTFAAQNEPKGIADALRIGQNFLAGDPCILILGDNIFFGHGFQSLLDQAAQADGATIFASPVKDPGQFGVVELDDAFKPIHIEEKPQRPRSDWAIAGLYYLDGSASEIACTLKLSVRGELEIISLLEHYFHDGELNVQRMHRGYAWFDAGTHDSMQQAAEFIRTLQTRQGLLICSPDELAYRKGLITLDQLASLAREQAGSSYGRMLLEICKQEQLHA